MTDDVLIVVPSLNEVAHIEEILEKMIHQSGEGANLICVADGGSTDGTVELVKTLAARHNRIRYLHNPLRIQSAAVNLGVKTYGTNFTYFVRVDAHAVYPDDFIITLLTEARQMGAQAVTVPMNSIGKSPKQSAIAAAQNSRLGNGGSAHRLTGHAGRWVDHGHHALMETALFEAVGGYDESFSHNEDAELDFRLGSAGGKIWLSGTTQIDYFPRSTFTALARQYFGFGAGRARTLLKHHIRPKLRQLVPMTVVPVALLTLLSPVSWLVNLPALLWISVVIAAGTTTGLKSPETRSIQGVYWVISALIVLQVSWSFGALRSILVTRGGTHNQ